MFNVIDLALLCLCLLAYFWMFYNIPILAAGVKSIHSKHKPQARNLSSGFLPTFSIIVPVKNEEKVIGRLLNALSKLKYPEDKREIIIVEDGSNDRTLHICLSYAKQHSNVTILRKSFSTGKPSALNYGVECSKGAIVAFFDADSVPEEAVLMEACKYFEDPKVAAVQGRTLSINFQENMLTQFISYEEAVWCEAYLRGKDVLNLFVHLRGSCQFIRRDALVKLKGFDEDVLSEDLEISARLTGNDYRIRYAPDVRTWQESPSDLKTLFKQRTRWLRGAMELAVKYGRLIAKPSLKSIDAEATLYGPFMLIASLMPYLATFYVFFSSFPFDIFWQIIVQFTTLATTLTIFICGLALIYVSKPRRVRNLLWLPFIYFYWSFQAFIALYAAFLILLRRPRIWNRTEKKGIIAKF